MRRLMLRLFAIAVVILALGGCTVRCEVEPMFYDTINKLLLDDDVPVMSKAAKKGTKK